MVAEWANESFQIQVGLLRRYQVRIPLEKVYMVKILNKKKLWTRSMDCDMTRIQPWWLGLEQWSDNRTLFKLDVYIGLRFIFTQKLNYADI